MRLPRDLSGAELAQLLRQYGYILTRQTGSRMRLNTQFMGREHSIPNPAHKQLRIGTLADIVSGVANYPESTREELARRLFEQ